MKTIRSRALFGLLLFVTVSGWTESVDSILGRAAGLLGAPYRGGGIAPDGFDCSGFVSYLYRPTVPKLPRISRDMARSGSAVAAGDWKPGDLLFYAAGANRKRVNHVAIWYGDGRIIHSISDGPETGVVLTPANSDYWARRYVGSRRVLPHQAAGTWTAPATPPPPAAPPAEGSPSPAAASPDEGSPASPAADPESSPWNDFDGILRGDFEAWRQADEEAFEAYRNSGG